jgi:hypothetical protein
MTWYYESGGQQQGPISDSELDNLLSQGKINLDTLVWREGQPGWAPLRAARPSGGAPPGIPSAPLATEEADIGLEVTRPAARPISTPSPSAPGAGSDFPQPGYVRCTATGRYFPPSEIIYIEGKPYSAGAKPQVVASLQSGSLLPSAGDSSGRNGPAWEQRETLGIWKAALETIKSVLLAPGQCFATMKREGGLGNPLLFLLLTGFVGGVATTVYQFVLQGAFASIMTSMGGNQMPALSMFGGTVIGGVVGLVLTPIILVIASFIWAGLVHLFLMMLKGANRPFESTMRSICYVYGAGMVFSIIPGCGAYIGGIWSIVSLCIGLPKVHETDTWRGVTAALLPIAVCCILYIGIIAVVIGTVGAAAAGSGGSFR